MCSYLFKQIVIGACPRFCVNGLMAGNCQSSQKKRNDRKQRTDRPPVGGLQKPADLIGENRLLKELTKRLVERALEAEMAEHLGHGKSRKTLKGEFGELPIEIPRDRDGSPAPWMCCIRSFIWTASASNPETQGRSRSKRRTWRWALI